MKIVATSGYFDPLHVGHLECLEKASKLGDKLIVIVNSDLQAKLKKGESFMKEEDRMKIISTLDCVDEVFLSIDTDKSQCKSLKHLKPDISLKFSSFTTIIPSQILLFISLRIERAVKPISIEAFPTQIKTIFPKFSYISSRS